MLPHHVQDLHLTGCCRNCRTAPCLASGPSVAGVSAALPAPEPLDLPNLRPASAEGSKGQHSALHNRRPSSGGGASLLSPPLHLALQSPLPRPPMPGSGAVWGRTWQSSKHWFQLGCGLNDWMFANFNACALPPPLPCLQVEAATTAACSALAAVSLACAALCRPCHGSTAPPPRCATCCPPMAQHPLAPPLSSSSSRPLARLSGPAAAAACCRPRRRQH